MNIAVFASGSGSNMQAIIDRENMSYKVKLVISDRKDAYVLTRAKKANIKSFIINPKDFTNEKEYSLYVLRLLKEENIDTIALAGYLGIIPDAIIDGYKNKIVNIHPSLLPSFGGMGFFGDYVHRAVLNSGAKFSGATVHFVTKEVDGGPIILQGIVPVLDEDTIESLQKRITETVEWDIYPKALELLAKDKIKIKGQRVETGNVHIK